MVGRNNIIIKILNVVLFATEQIIRQMSVEFNQITAIIIDRRIKIITRDQSLIITLQ
jgi:hypothetical protein